MVFTHRIMEVNLTTQTHGQYAIDPKWAHDFIGGRGLGIRLLWERTPKGIDPLAPEAELYLLTGPLTGIAPGGAHTCLVFKSPQTNTLNYSITGAQWGQELRSAGWEGLMITGRSERPVYLLIEDGAVQFRDASHLWGLTTFAAEKQLRQELKDSRVRILNIGPAGEKMIPYASVQQEMFRSAARGGGGAVWGSKNLKAVAVRGTMALPVHNPSQAIPIRNEMEKILKDSRTTIRRTYDLMRWGGSMTNMPHSDEGHLDVANYREGHWPEIHKIGGLAYERLCRARSRGCFGCPMGCMPLGVVREGEFSGNVVCPDLEAAATMGSGILVNDLNAMVYLTRWADEYGFDSTSLGNITGFAMECYENGLLPEAKFEGIDLSWGNVEGVLALWRRILNREGIGALFAEGVKKAAAKIGGGSEHYAMQVKGREFACFTPQADHKQGLQYAVSDKGPAHHFGGKAEHTQQRTWADLLTACTWQRRMIKPEVYLKLLNAVTDWQLQAGDWPLTAKRILLLAQAYNIREGLLPLRDDVLPERVHVDKLTTGIGAGQVYPREQFSMDRKAWYGELGCDAEGFPTPEALKEHGLEFAMPVMESSRRAQSNDVLKGN
ncbi:aldehyde:ferredoxin oxidoreductase [Desulfitobacterium sp. LBE]|uniref:aldehyde ferredoxin oxidoreductase family protein n=1 Tax=Desulfitobacterium sp. LBE TaxID=884086 RepID=UPI001199DC1C|nr:aldehyde ferredoxin oxidoreductase C-terminal domain-containing protein [Desulfitobacterium sp. LBE]TWH57065.1 aldehyde:ferredoxin oxidoreductase [Desulfitobacterium sp. LBE]